MPWGKCIIKSAKWCPPHVVFLQTQLLFLCYVAQQGHTACIPHGMHMHWLVYHPTRHAHGLVIITERVSQRCFQRYKGEGVLMLILTNLVAMALGYSHLTERLWTWASSMFIGSKWSFCLWWKRQILHYCAWHRKILLRLLFGAGSVRSVTKDTSALRVLLCY